MTKNIFFTALVALTALGATTMPATAQVHIGSLNEPKATLEVTGKATDATAPGIIAPRLSLLNLQSANAKYTADQKGALVYIDDITTGTPTPAGKTVNVTAIGYYYFDGAVWQTLKVTTEPWNVAGTTTPATSNTQNIYQTGSVGIRTNRPAATLDVSTSSADTAGIIAPRMTLAELNAKKSFYTTRQTGAFVYITDASTSPIAGYSDAIHCTGFVYWDGAKWISNCAVETTWIKLVEQPKTFSFYEQGTETEVPLTFNAIGSSAVTYKWYKQVGNVHIRIGEPCDAADGTGYNTNSFTPKVVKGKTTDAANCGFYRYYCVAKNQTGDSIISNTAEVAVGCGAKNLQGEWISFLCFNLGARLLTINSQITYSITVPNDASGFSTYVANQEYLYGDYYQWGRIGDGHEKYHGIVGSIYPQSGTTVAYGGLTSSDFENGNLCLSTIHCPTKQIKRGTTWYGKFITYSPTHDWAASLTEYDRDNLWETRRVATNDPCTKIKKSYTGAAPLDPASPTVATSDWFSYYPPAGDNDAAGGGAENTGWRMPSVDDWGSIFRGNTTGGYESSALSNTWIRNTGHGWEVRPDGVTTTLFIPAGGYRDGNGYLRWVNYGLGNYHTSNSIAGTNVAYQFTVTESLTDGINPRMAAYRHDAHMVRCVKN